MFLHSLAHIFFSWVNNQILYFERMAEENIMYEQLLQVCREKVSRMRVFWGNFGSPQNYLLLHHHAMLQS